MTIAGLPILPFLQGPQEGGGRPGHSLQAEPQRTKGQSGLGSGVNKLWS